MFAPLIEVWLKSLPLKFMLHATRSVIEFEDWVIEVVLLSNFVAKIVSNNAFCNLFETLFFISIFFVYSSSYALSKPPVIISAKKLSN